MYKETLVLYIRAGELRSTIMSIPENTIFEVKIGYLANDQQCYNVLHYLAGDTYAGLSPFDITTALLDNLDNQLPTAGRLLNNMRLFMGTNVLINELSAQAIYPTRFRAVKGSYASAGLAGNACNAQNVAAYIEKFGEEAGRNRIGSFHLGGLADEVFENGELSAGAFANLQSLAANIAETIEFTSGGVDFDFEPVILNKEPVPGSDPVRYAISGFTEIFGTVALQRLRTQRTRTKGNGI